MNPDILEIIKYGSMAPSADNNQPWYFKIKDNSLLVYFDKDKKSINDFSNRDNAVDLISVGALLENIKIACSNYGYRSEIKYNDEFDDNFVAEIIFSQDKKTSHFLYDFIPVRSVNRNKYKNNLIIENEIYEEMSEMAKEGGANIYFVTEKEKIENLAEIISWFDDFLWTDRKKRSDILKSFRFSKREENEKKDGLSVHSLGLKLWEKYPFIVLAKTAKRIPLNFPVIRLSSKNNSYNLVRNSSALFILTMPESSKKDYLRGGETLQKIWLYLSSKNISYQPMFGPLFSLIYEFFPEGKEKLSFKNRRVVEKISKELINYFGISRNNALIGLCRIGYCDKAPVPAVRRDIQKLIQEI